MVVRVERECMVVLVCESEGWTSKGSNKRRLSRRMQPWFAYAQPQLGALMGCTAHVTGRQFFGNVTVLACSYKILDALAILETRRWTDSSMAVTPVS
jgi:hypothetical protein